MAVAVALPQKRDEEETVAQEVRRRTSPACMPLRISTRRRNERPSSTAWNPWGIESDKGWWNGASEPSRFSKDKPRFIEPLDVIKFLCKDLWTLIFRKQIDNLKTNHRGVYVLTDNTFRPFQRMSVEAGENATIRALPFLWFPCGLIRGALASMGIDAVVHGDTSELPAAVFQIKTTAAATTTGMTNPTGMNSAPVGSL